MRDCPRCFFHCTSHFSLHRLAPWRETLFLAALVRGRDGEPPAAVPLRVYQCPVLVVSSLSHCYTLILPVLWGSLFVGFFEKQVLDDVLGKDRCNRSKNRRVERNEPHCHPLYQRFWEGFGDRKGCPSPEKPFRICS